MKAILVQEVQKENGATYPYDIVLLEDTVDEVQARDLIAASYRDSRPSRTFIVAFCPVTRTIFPNLEGVKWLFPSGEEAKG
jgi:hypothetical protein